MKNLRGVCVWGLLGAATVSCALPDMTTGYKATAGSGGAEEGGTTSRGGTSTVRRATSSAAGGTTASATTGTTVSNGGTSTVVTTGSSGIASTGGTTSSGGASSTGGKSSTGGASSTGGKSSTGGASSTGGKSSTGGASSTGGTTSTTIPTCPGTGGPTMVKLPEGYCIDSTEVTRDQYSAWLATTTSATISAQDVTNCSWNTTFIPNASCMAGSYVYQETGYGNHPQVCVDWCDAYAYCAGVGKRLCGKRGGGANAYTDYATASASQWYNACVSGSALNTYPFGKTYSATACNGSDLAKGTTTVVGNLPGCQAPAPYAGVYDLSGNVWEWEDSCRTTGSTTYCRLRGGNFYSSSNTSACGYEYEYSRSSESGSMGFRCCAS